MEDKARIMQKVVGSVGICFLAILSCLVPVSAKVDFTVGSVQGELSLSQESDTAPVLIKGMLKNLTAGLHGFHVHESGNLTGGCGSSLGHFNPDNVNHAAPNDTARHVGDLGNIKVASDGTVNLELSDKVLSLQESSSRSIIGRAFVVHADEDDLGKGGNDGSKKTGNAGGRIGCGVVTLRSDSGAGSNNGAGSDSGAAHAGFFIMEFSSAVVVVSFIELIRRGITPLDN